MRTDAILPRHRPRLKSRLPNLRGRLIANQPLGEFTWFRVGGPAQALFMPEDETISLTCCAICRPIFPSPSSAPART